MDLLALVSPHVVLVTGQTKHEEVGGVVKRRATGDSTLFTALLARVVIGVLLFRVIPETRFDIVQILHG